MSGFARLESREQGLLCCVALTRNRAPRLACKGQPPLRA